MLDFDVRWCNFLCDSETQNLPAYVSNRFNGVVASMHQVLHEQLNEKATVRSVAKAIVTFQEQFLKHRMFHSAEYQAELFYETPHHFFDGQKYLQMLHLTLRTQKAKAQVLASIGESSLGVLGYTRHSLFSGWVPGAMSAEMLARFEAGSLTIFDIVRDAPGLIFFGMFRGESD